MADDASANKNDCQTCPAENIAPKKSVWIAGAILQIRFIFCRESDLNSASIQWVNQLKL